MNLLTSIPLWNHQENTYEQYFLIITMYAHKVILLWVGVLKIKMNSIYGFIKMYSNYWKGGWYAGYN